MIGPLTTIAFVESTHQIGELLRDQLAPVMGFQLKLRRISPEGIPEIYPFFEGPNITKDILCAGKESTFSFLEAVLDEIIELFPSEYVHIGGDEAPKDRWKECPKCQARIKAEGLRGEDQLQSYFIQRIEKYVNSKGRRIIGWDEILEGGLASNAAVMSWRGVDGGIEAARSGHNVVMSPTSHCYFDYTYERIDTQRAFSFDPIPPQLDKSGARFILGLQANFWSHIDRTVERVDHQLFPRLLAIAERGWSSRDASDWEDFQRRLRLDLDRLDHLGISYRNPVEARTAQAEGPRTPQARDRGRAPH